MSTKFLHHNCQHRIKSESKNVLFLLLRIDACNLLQPNSNHSLFLEYLLDFHFVLPVFILRVKCYENQKVCFIKTCLTAKKKYKCHNIRTCIMTQVTNVQTFEPTLSMRKVAHVDVDSVSQSALIVISIPCALLFINLLF